MVLVERGFAALRSIKKAINKIETAAVRFIEAPRSSVTQSRRNSCVGFKRGIESSIW